MIDLFKIIVLFIVTLLFSSCNFEIPNSGKAFKGSGNVVTKTRDLKDFTKIEVSRNLDCEVIQSNEFKVLVIADDNLQKHIKTDVTNGVLKITSDYGNYKNVKSKLVQVYLPVIEALEATSAANLTSKSVLKSNNILIKSSSASDIVVNIESEKIILEATSASEITANGKAINLSTLSSSASDINAQNLIANNVNAQSTSGSDCKVHPVLELKASASSASTIVYVNKPKNISKEASSGGDIYFE